MYHELNPPIRARYIRFRPVAWHNHISMRVELYGCRGTVEYLCLSVIYNYEMKDYVTVSRTKINFTFKLHLEVNERTVDD